MKVKILLFVFSFFLISCSQSSQEITQLEKQTEIIHDEAMKDLSVMQRTARAIKAHLGKSDLSAEEVKICSEILKQMDKADADMSNWMVNYKSPTGMAPKEALAYLLEQKKLIEQNHKDIVEATQAGKAQLTKP